MDNVQDSHKEEPILNTYKYEIGCKTSFINIINFLQTVLNPNIWVIFRCSIYETIETFIGIINDKHFY